MRRHIGPIAIGAVLALAGCQDLTVGNPNVPDRERDLVLGPDGGAAHVER